MLQQIAVARRARRQQSCALTVQAADPVFAAAVHKAPCQQIADRIKIAFQYLAKPRFDIEHGVYQRTQKIAKRGYYFTFALYHEL